MQYLTGHGQFRQKLHQMNIVEDNMCHTCGVVAMPEHIVMRCQETEHLARDEIELLGEIPVTDIQRTPKLVAAIRGLTDRISSYYKRKFINGVSHRVQETRKGKIFTLKVSWWMIMSAQPRRDNRVY